MGTTMTVEPCIIYLDGQPRAITIAKGAEQAVASFRAANLGQKLPGVVTAQSIWTAPIEDVQRVCLAGIFMRIFTGDAAAAMARAQRGS